MEESVVRALLQSIPAGVALFRLDGGGYHPLFLNERMLDRSGMTGEEFAADLDDGLDRLVHPSDLERLRLALYKAGVTGGRFCEAARLRTRDGSFRWMNVYLNAAPEAGGNFLLCFLLVDIDSQKENELKLERTYEELLGVMNNTPGGIVVFDTKNDREPFPTFISSGMYRLLQGTREEVLSLYGADYLAAVHPDERENLVRLLEESLRNLSRFQLTLRLRTVSGTYLWVDANATVTASEGRRSIYASFINSSADRDTQRLLRRILDSFARRQYDNICLVDGRNHAFRVLTSGGRKGGELALGNGDYDQVMDRDLLSRVVPEERDGLSRALRLRELYKSLKSREDVEFLFTVQSPDGSLWCKKLWICWLDAGAKQLAFVLSDYTELRRQQIEHQEALMGALQTAERANAAKSDFLSRMSHDIRTPLNAIMGFTQMCLADGEPGTKTRERLSKIESASQYLLSLVNDVLDMSRIESGSYSIKKERFELSDLLGGVCSILSAQCEDRHLSYRCDVADNVRPAYIGDRLKLQQVLVNILGNSVKFTPEGGAVSLAVEEAAATSRRAVLRFTIRDNGVGISQEFIPHLFETFTQEERLSPSQPGTGLGLAICKSIVTMMNGTIRVASRKNEGSEFVVEIQADIPPAESAGQTEKPAGQAVPSGKSEDAYDFRGRRVLLAEDNPMNQEIANYLLEKVGLSVDTVPNGKEACERFAAEAGHYDAVILDIRMPVMDGLQAALAIRSMPGGDVNSLPILAMSADAFEEDVSKSLSSGINAYLTKPIQPVLLYQALEKAFGLS